MCNYDLCASCDASTRIDASIDVVIATVASPTASTSTSDQAFTSDLAGATASASTVAQAFTSDLAEVLLGTKLNQYEDALRELGCAFPEDLCDVEEADLQKIGMKKIELKRLQRVAAKYK